MASLGTRLKVAGGMLVLILGARLIADRYGNRIREQLENRRRKKALENELKQLEDEMDRLEVEMRGLDIEP
ncbi:MAG: hypothetical protein QGI83_16540 [Candidatus Latescibacteria bacterium]|nr:hypothetical protein [Candidatus Latescibacterota bacterium]